MRPDEKELLGNVVKISAVAGFVHFFVEVSLHEYGHYWVASLLGAPMVIDGERSLWAAGQVVPPATQALVMASGGLIAGLLLLGLYVFLRKPYRYGLLPLVAANFAYAPLDATMAGRELGLLALVMVWIVIFGVYFARFLGWTGPRRPKASAEPVPKGRNGHEGIRTPV